jgi:protein-S-isoprenylcysteine O-methyltransferase Ste14
VITLPLLLAILAFLIEPRWIAWAQVPLPAWTRWVGAVGGAAAVPLVWWVVSSLGRNISETILTKQDHQLVMRGPYRWVRHPLYAVGILMLASASLLMSSALVAVLTLLVIVGIRRVVIPGEEAALVQKFGDAYIEYCRRTGRLLPRRALH